MRQSCSVDCEITEQSKRVVVEHIKWFGTRIYSIPQSSCVMPPTRAGRIQKASPRLNCCCF